MSKGKGKIRQGDTARVLLTEILPYEIPLRFSNLHFYALAHENTPPDGIISLISQWARNESPDFEPYCYWIQQGQAKRRHLGIIHPLLYSDICSFYSKNAQQVISLCSKSEWSLRHPQQIASVYYDRVDVENVDEENTEGNEAGVEVGLTETKASSYLSYWEFNFLWKFFESKKFWGLSGRLFHTDGWTFLNALAVSILIRFLGR